MYLINHAREPKTEGICCMQTDPWWETFWSGILRNPRGDFLGWFLLGVCETLVVALLGVSSLGCCMKSSWGFHFWFYKPLWGFVLGVEKVSLGFTFLSCRRIYVINSVKDLFCEEKYKTLTASSFEQVFTLWSSEYNWWKSRKFIGYMTTSIIKTCVLHHRNCAQESSGLWWNVVQLISQLQKKLH